MTTIGVIGCGYWGPNHIRIFSQLENSQVSICADLNEERLLAMKRLFPQIKMTTDYKEILLSSQIDAVCIAAPTDLHFQLTKEALESGKHVLCEKPLALTAGECEELAQLASAQKKMLMVGHVFVFNAGIIRLKEYIQSGELGSIYYAHSQRTNLGPFRYDVNALWDLAAHDISILNYLFDQTPLNASARGQKYLGSNLEDLTFATIEYPHKVLAHIHVSWLDPKKVRQITIVGDKKMVVWDDLDNPGPVKLYDKHVEKTSTFYETYGEFQLLSKEGSTTAPKIEATEPLKVQNQYFVDCIEKNHLPDRADASKGGEVVKALSAIQESMDRRGEVVIV